MADDGLVIGIHPSVATIFPPATLRDELDDVSARVELLTDDSDLDGLDGLVTFTYDDAFLSADLEWVHCVLAGVDAFPLDALERHGIRLTNSSGIHGDAVGDTVLGYMLQFARRLHVYRDNEPKRKWRYPDWDETFTLAGETVCVVGLGTLGQGVAARADGVGMDVVGVRRTPTPVPSVRQIYTPDALSDAIADARFVVLTPPLTDRTRGLVGSEELDAMREDAYLVNVARGPVVDQASLIGALEAGGIAGAALDVFEEEPLPDDSPLWEMENVIVTPHAAGATRAYGERVAALVEENTKRIRTDDALANQIV
ncbi:D-2-hydroxyacid dehydrogenase [Halobellus sp. Atlit-38R]|uniref:D-2-hydroxyacid dehydrogenase n=2 Tax=Haloferacaceae TaxID=1644056 RepID=UPI000EF1CC55|nr:D-2-hydroxyacid dehydrogenase [Halobellus sp. Atlit-38R]RLM90682.1 D-2-hydroxyacid dehydrogenase [Halobellus sp. Atlit-38R]